VRRIRNSKVASLLILYGLLATGHFTIAADLAVCASCHGADGSGAGFDHVPILAGTPAAHLEEALYAYQDGARRCAEEPVMCDTVATMSEAEVVEFAEHFSGMRRILAGETLNAALAETGKRIHAEHCTRCHILPGSKNAEYALGIPLHGQRSAYLKLAFDSYLSGDRETLVPGMAEKLRLLDADDIDALISYYASYQP